MFPFVKYLSLYYKYKYIALHITIKYSLISYFKFTDFIFYHFTFYICAPDICVCIVSLWLFLFYVLLLFHAAVKIFNCFYG